jgi:hypothetical protein
MNKIETTPGSMNKSDKQWVVDILKEDNLKLAESNHLGTYGRAQLGPATKVLMWAMRIYVVLSFILIIAQIYISLRSNG